MLDESQIHVVNSRSIMASAAAEAWRRGHPVVLNLRAPVRLGRAHLVLIVVKMTMPIVSTIAVKQAVLDEILAFVFVEQPSLTKLSEHS